MNPVPPTTADSNPSSAPIPVSIVIAVWHGVAALEACLGALAHQRDDATEVIVVSNRPFPPDVGAKHAWSKLIEAGSTLLIPDLWAIGIARSTHPIVAITTAHFVPAPTYLSALRRAHTRLDAAGIGGAIDPRPDGDAVTWATYFLRYSAYIGWQSERRVDDFAGDNASYKRATLPTAPELDGQGFWEQQVHRTLIAAGHALAFVPDIRMTQWASFGFRAFCTQRFQHGREFGNERIQRAAASARLMRIATAPLIPLLILGRIAGRVMRSRRDLGPFLRSFPVIVAFALAWSFGEGIGYITGSASPEVRRPPQPVPRA